MMGAILRIIALFSREPRETSTLPGQRSKFTQCVIARCGTYQRAADRSRRPAGVETDDHDFLKIESPATGSGEARLSTACIDFSPPPGNHYGIDS